MKLSVLTTLVVAALGATSAMAQSQPLTRDEVKAELMRAQSSREIDRNDQNYGTWWSSSPSSSNYSQSYNAGPSSDGSMSTASGSMSATTGMGAAGRSFDSGMSTGPNSRSDVTSDRDSALRSGRWTNNDIDGVRRLDPNESSATGHTYKGMGDAY